MCLVENVVSTAVQYTRKHADAEELVLDVGLGPGRRIYDFCSVSKPTEACRHEYIILNCLKSIERRVVSYFTPPLSAVT